MCDCNDQQIMIQGMMECASSLVASPILSPQRHSQPFVRRAFSPRTARVYLCACMCHYVLCPDVCSHASMRPLCATALPQMWAMGARTHLAGSTWVGRARLGRLIRLAHLALSSSFAMSSFSQGSRGALFALTLSSARSRPCLASSLLSNLSLARFAIGCMCSVIVRCSGSSLGATAALSASLVGSHFLISSARSCVDFMPLERATVTAPTPMSAARAVPPINARVAPLRASASASAVGGSGNFSIRSLNATLRRYAEAP
mmetsp:Transcript_50789/g.101076  ORF Transcript_50789/g.101076 Transcript_50789/m.101076 type:complete len:260 (-) Transcript_50789:155-934(-)